jgi:hypothetical protein
MGKVLLELLTGRSPMHDLTKLVQSSLTECDRQTEKFDPDTGEALAPNFDMGSSAFGTILDPALAALDLAAEVSNWRVDGLAARALAEIALEMTALDDDARLTVCDALPRIEVLCAR